MKTLIIEDEYPAAEKLEKLLRQADPDIEVLDVLDSIESAVQWLVSHPAPDLIFSDIQLSDGLSFEIYEQVSVSSPIIFTTAYDEYAIRAFRVKSIDYLLKPIKATELEASLEKYRSLTGKDKTKSGDQADKIRALMELLEVEKPRFRTRFLIKGNDRFTPVSTQEIAFFFTQNEIVYLYLNDGTRLPMDSKLEQLEKELDPDHFYRLNRQYLASLKAIKSIHPYFNNRLKLYLNPEAPSDVIVSRDKARGFRKWLGESG